MPQITIISESVTKRLEYVCKVMFEIILKCEYSLLESKNDLPANSLIINYSTTPIKNSIHIIPSGLLEEEAIQQHEISSGEFEGIKTIFHSGKGDIPFDVFSAVFYMITRYEEYLPFERDIHGRFSAKQSTAFKNGFHDLPIVELWVQPIARKTGINFPSENYSSILTIDIDDAWRYRNKGVFRTIGALFKSVIRFNFKTFLDRAKVISRLMPDPFYTYDYLFEVAQNTKISLHFFVLMGNNCKEDTAYKPKSSLFRKLIRKLNEKSVIGIHPSYASFGNKKLVSEELNLLKKTTNSDIRNSRQHYLLLDLPGTYRRLIQLGIRNDFSMGWHDLPGFRAGISRPFPFYDLLKEEETKLVLHPFVTMDRTLKDYTGMNLHEAIEEIQKLKELVISVGGQWSMIWHNDSISEYGEWKGWRKVFDASVL